MPDVDLLAPLTAVAQRIGKRLLDRQRPAPARTLPELRAAFAAVDGPAAEALRVELARLRPGAQWADELELRLPELGEVWVTDAVDGAVQYLQGLPQWCVTITLVRDRVPVAAVLHSPPLGETYAAAVGHGATRDGAPVVPSAKADTSATVIATSHPPFAAEQPAATARAGQSHSALLPEVSAVRNLGPTSWQLADTAAGRLDAFWMYGTDDTNLLGGALVAREAGACVTDTQGAPWTAGSDSLLVTGRRLHGRFLELLRDVR
ncbi:inositol monophosphatase family protein [Streptomyces silvisoli]|uniref:Inositol monophosphatase family protein n=1 Tax=Streptomyces silvisoli TaxID=3034235 RepID=A0ABT5ZDF8_9ACTN|nr:inositol monophosphatase family protein [Streptomyces silvisoli]MDF3287847.1 inositol monophosphatase family protein [Streptomyces silvisoli]